MRNREHVKKISEGGFFYVSALAGTGKTTLIYDVCSYLKNKKVLYLSFNEKIAKEASAKFPNNVDCKTIHSVAYKFFGYKYKNKLRTSIPYSYILEELPIKNRKDRFKIASAIMEKINYFLYSEFLNIEDSFGINDSDSFKFYVKTIFEKMEDISHSFPITHDFYLKLFQKSSMLTDYLSKYSWVMLDEAQDSNSAIKSIVFNQGFLFNKNIVIVGDPNQYIYGFRGSINIFDSIDGNIFKKIELNKTYRFGREIARIANKILLLIRNSEPK